MLIPKKNRREVYKYLFKGEQQPRGVPCTCTCQCPTACERLVTHDLCCLRRAEGVLQAEKDFNLEQHPEIEGVPNLHVIKLMQSFKSRELVTERFAWRHYYW